MKLFAWIGTDKGGFEQRNLVFCRYLHEKYDIKPTIGVYHRIKGVEFPQKVIKPFFKTSKLTGYNNAVVSFQLSSASFLNDFDVFFGWAVKKMKPLIVSRVGGNLREFLSWNKKVFSRLFYIPLIALTDRQVRTADLIISCSPQATEYVKELGVNKKKICQSSNFVDTNIFNPKAKKRASKKDNSKFKVLFVGRDDPIKNFEALRKACKQLNVHLIAVGIERPHEKNVTYVPWSSQERLAQLYSEADLCAMPSLYESFGTVVLESLACKTPVLVSEGVTAGKLLEKFVTVTSTRSEDIKSAIQSIIERYEEVKRKTEKGYRKVVRDYSKDVVLKREAEAIFEAYNRRQRRKRKEEKES